MDTSTVINLLIIAAIIWFTYSRMAPIKGLRNVSSIDFANEIEQSQAHLIDVREPNEYKTGFIAGAINLPLSQLKSRIGEIPKDKLIFLYCRSGMRSKQAARILRKNGFTNLSHLKGGMLTWSGKRSK